MEQKMFPTTPIPDGKNLSRAVICHNRITAVFASVLSVWLSLVLEPQMPYLRLTLQAVPQYLGTRLARLLGT